MTTAHSSAYLIVGDDDYLVEEALSKVVGDAGEHSVVAFSPDDPVGEILQAASTPSMFGDRRVVVVHRVEGLSAEAQREILEYLESPSPDVSLVLISGKSSAKLASAVKKVGRVIDAAKGRRNELFGWLRQEARQRELRIVGDGLGALVEAVGEDRHALSNALEELTLAYGPGARVGEEEVRRQFRGHTEARIFAFVDAVAGRQTGPALEHLHRLLRSGESPQAMFWTLTRHFRMLLQSQPPSSKLARDLGIPGWRAEKLLRQAREFTRDELVRSFRALAQADHKMKNSQEPEGLTLERAVVVITGK